MSGDINLAITRFLHIRNWDKLDPSIVEQYFLVHHTALDLWPLVMESLSLSVFIGCTASMIAHNIGKPKTKEFRYV